MCVCATASDNVRACVRHMELQPDRFPSIFGPDEDAPLDARGSHDAMNALAQGISRAALDNQCRLSYDGFRRD